MSEIDAKLLKSVGEAIWTKGGMAEDQDRCDLEWNEVEDCPRYARAAITAYEAAKAKQPAPLSARERELVEALKKAAESFDKINGIYDDPYMQVGECASEMYATAYSSRNDARAVLERVKA